MVITRAKYQYINRCQSSCFPLNQTKKAQVKLRFVDYMFASHMRHVFLIKIILFQYNFRNKKGAKLICDFLSFSTEKRRKVALEDDFEPASKKVCVVVSDESESSEDDSSDDSDGDSDLDNNVN